MRAVFGLVLLVGMGLAGFAVYTVKGYFDTQAAVLDRERQRAANVIATVDVYSPARALNYGELITKEDVKLIKYARDYLPEGVFLTEEELFPQGPDNPRVVKRPMEVNEPILLVKVTEPGQPQGITALLDRGMRAFPLPNNVTEAFAEELRPTDRLDIYWSGQLNNGRATTRLIMTGLEVIATEDDTDGGARGVVIQVTPEEFAALAAAQGAGRLSLTPVGTGDDTVIEPIQTDIQTILGIVDEPEPEPEVIAPVIEKERCYVTKRVGTERIQEEVAC